MTGKNLELINSLCDTINGLEWDIWATFTMKQDTGIRVAEEKFMWFLNSLRFCEFVRVDYTYIIERHRYKNGCHIHSLMRFREDDRINYSFIREYEKKNGKIHIMPFGENWDKIRKWLDLWRIRNGMVRAEWYLKSIGAHGYLAKKIANDIGTDCQWEIKYDKLYDKRYFK